MAGLVLTALPVILARGWPKVFSGIAIPSFPIAMMLGLILLITGTVRAIKQERRGKFVGEMLLGLFFIGLGIVLTSELIKGHVRGVYVVGFIPIPLIVVTPIAAIAGLYLFIEGSVSLFTGRENPFRPRGKYYR